MDDQAHHASDLVVDEGHAFERHLEHDEVETGFSVLVEGSSVYEKSLDVDFLNASEE